MSEDQPKGEQKIGEFSYARDLFVQLFKDDSALINLGYTAKQMAITRPILRYLEEEGELREPGYASFGSEERDEGVNIYSLSGGGHTLFASREVERLDLLSLDAEVFLEGIQRLEAIRFFEDEPEAFVAIVNMIPSAMGYDDLDKLVKGLYEGTYEGGQLGRVSLEKSSPLSKIKSRVSPKTAVFRAAWVDEATKLELVVETNYLSKAIRDEDDIKEYNIWRRLPTQELDGKAWIPFGRKPNVPNKRIREILEAKRDQARVVLVPQTVKA